jgi:aryl-alcohol dehydrogenase-like predicted oxidoreductase
MAMLHRLLGNTGLAVSPLALGTVALGLDYGIREAGDGKPARHDAITLIHAACDAGINLFDTAPAYGVAESVLGEALAAYPDCHIATKVILPPQAATDTALRQSVLHSIDQSRSALGRDCLTILQVHNLLEQQAAQPALRDVLLDARSSGRVAFLGASVYTEQEALAAIASGWVDVLQVAFNLLDQRMAQRVFAAAEEKGVGILSRSAFLKGALTPRARMLPAALSPLRHAVEKLTVQMDVGLEQLPAAALQFCLGEERISAVLIGPGNLPELETALEQAERRLTPTLQQAALGFALNEPALVDPRLWSIQ